MFFRLICLKIVRYYTHIQKIVLTFTTSIPSQNIQTNLRLLHHQRSNCNQTRRRNQRRHLRTSREASWAVHATLFFQIRLRTECVLFSPPTIHNIHHSYLQIQSESIVKTFIWTLIFDTGEPVLTLHMTKLLLLSCEVTVLEVLHFLHGTPR